MRALKKLMIKMFLCMALLSMFITGCEKKAGDEKEAEKPEVKTGEVEGVLLEFTGGEIALENAKGKYIFDVSQALIKTTNMRSGDELIVSYEGELTGTDTSGVKVTAVQDLGNNNADKEEKEAVGTLVEASMNTITIKQNDGTLLTFLSNNCEHDIRNGLREGNWIVVTYVGEIKGDNTQNVAVVKITDHDENKIEQTQKSMNIKAVDETLYATAGVHIRASYSTVSETVGSLAKGGSIRRTGICDNGWSRVIYNNHDAYIYGDYLTTAAPAPEAKPAKTDGSAPATLQQGTQPAPARTPGSYQPKQQQTASGTVVDATMNTLTVDVGGQVYTVNIMDAAHEYANGIQTGNIVTITYEGNLADPNVMVFKVQDQDPNTAAENSLYTGAIQDATMNTVTILTDDGAVLTFDKSNANEQAEDIQIGMKVDITVDMTASAPQENILVAKEIKLHA